MKLSIEIKTTNTTVEGKPYVVAALLERIASDIINSDLRYSALTRGAVEDRCGERIGTWSFHAGEPESEESFRTARVAEIGNDRWLDEEVAAARERGHVA